MDQLPIGASLDLLDTPALVIDIDRMDANIAALFRHLAPSGVNVRPHLKTGKSPELARRLLSQGACGICVAKVSEAEVMVEGGITDILITTEVMGEVKLARLARLAASTRQLKVVVDCLAGAQALDEAVAGNGWPLDIVIELNVGQNRCGAQPGSPAVVLARQISALPHLRLVGLQGYEGHLQHIADANERQRRCEAAMELLTATARLLRDGGFPVEIVTTGGTGTAGFCAGYPGVTEVQPGSFLFLDLAYHNVLESQCGYLPALSVLTTVISRPMPGIAVVDAGLKALSTDMGHAAPINLPGVRYRPAGDEHGILEWEDSRSPLMLGERVALTPSHIDTTVNLHETYYAQRAGVIVAVWPIAARGKIQ